MHFPLSRNFYPNNISTYQNNPHFFSPCGCTVAIVWKSHHFSLVAYWWTFRTFLSFVSPGTACPGFICTHVTSHNASVAVEYIPSSRMADYSPRAFAILIDTVEHLPQGLIPIHVLSAGWRAFLSTPPHRWNSLLTCGDLRVCVCVSPTMHEIEHLPMCLRAIVFSQASFFSHATSHGCPRLLQEKWGDRQSPGTRVRGLGCLWSFYSLHVKGTLRSWHGGFSNLFQPMQSGRLSSAMSRTLCN